MKQYVLLLTFIFFSLCIHAQKETYWWYFGFNAGLTFSQLQPLTSTTGVTVSDMPTALSDGPVYTGEGCFSIADRDGNFLFASDGKTVYNKNRAVMNNGTGLKGNDSSTQSGIIVPRPEADGEYFLITCPVYNNNATWLTYSTVSLSTPEYGDLGTVINKNINLPFTAGLLSSEFYTLFVMLNGVN